VRWSLSPPPRSVPSAFAEPSEPARASVPTRPLLQPTAVSIGHRLSTNHTASKTSPIAIMRPTA
jgi:hypothetical protein